FKGLKLQGVTTLPGVNRPAGPGAQPANDWYADYQDWAVANQDTPNTLTGGSWVMGFSCCSNDQAAGTRIVGLVLSPVALVLPSPNLFSTVGLSQTTTKSVIGDTHTVTANAQSANNTPVPGATITFTVTSGPNAGQTGLGTTNANGVVSFTYTGS